MSNFSSSGMRELIKSCSNDLKQFSLTNVENAREDTFTDKHVEAFDLAKLTSLKIAKISMKPGHKYLSITDLFFYQLIAIDAFPALMLQLCLVSTMGLASYLKVVFPLSFVADFKPPSIFRNGSKSITPIPSVTLPAH